MTTPTNASDRERRVLNFAAIVPMTVAITARDGTEYALRDDVPADVMLRMFIVRGLSERMSALQQEMAADTPSAEVRAAVWREWEDHKAETRDICLAIFRWSDPAITAEELAQRFTYEEQLAIANLFFTMRMPGSSPLPGASPSSGATTSTPKNRQQRRRSGTGGATR